VRCSHTMQRWCLTPLEPLLLSLLEPVSWLSYWVTIVLLEQYLLSQTSELFSFPFSYSNFIFRFVNTCICKIGIGFHLYSFIWWQIYYSPTFSGNVGRGYNKDWLCIKEFVLYTWSSAMIPKKLSEEPWISYR
jgi:hypothetical protein